MDCWVLLVVMFGVNNYLICHYIWTLWFLWEGRFLKGHGKGKKRIIRSTWQTLEERRRIRKEEKDVIGEEDSVCVDEWCLVMK